MNRPTSVTVFGILNIVFGIFGLCGVLVSSVALMAPGAGVGNPVFELMEENLVYGTWVKAGTILGAVATLLLLVAGCGLLAAKPWARLLSVYYGVYGIVMSVVGFVFNAIFLFPVLIRAMENAQGPEAAGAVGGVIGGVVGGLAGLIYPVLLIYFMTRPRVVSFFSGDGPQTAGAINGADAMPAVSVTSDNPYQSPATSSTPPASGTPGTPGSLDEAIATIIPYRNGPALIAYYLGLFSLLACIPLVGILGIIMAVTAFVCGVQGLRRASEDPDARGRVHAWIGIIGGAVCGILGIIIQALLIFALVAAAAGA